MKIEYLTHYSGHLNREMQVKRYGHQGKVMIIFPTSGGRFHEAEDFGLINSIRDVLTSGKIQVYCIDSIDTEGYLGFDVDWGHRTHMIYCFEQYLITEFIPFVKHHSQRFDPYISVGCSMGAFHALNFGLRHPDVFDQVIALSDIFDARFFFGEYGNHEFIYQNSPTDYLWKMDDSFFLNYYHQNDYIVCVGQGDFERESVIDTKKMEEAFKFKQIDAWFDYWGMDVSHDWVWWRLQLPYYMKQLGY